MRVASVALFAIVAVAADWPRFRGPNGTGTADVPAILLTAATPATAAWTLALPGGFSSPVIVDGKLFIQSSSADGATRLFHRIDPATGAIVWTQTRPGKPGHIHAKNSLASGTPAADADRVYCVFWDGIGLDLCAYDHAGTAVWAKPLGPFASQHGPGISPIVHAGLVVVNVDQDGAAEVVAFDAKTGTEAWRAKRKPFRACYTPPVVRPLADGATELVVASTAGLTGYDPTTGRIHWNWDWPFAGMALRTIGTPVLVDDLVIAAAGDGGGSRSLVAIRPGPTPQLVWEKRRDTPYVPGLVAVGKHLYWVTDAGVATCAEAATGNNVWAERLFNKPVSASPILGGGVVFAVAEDGTAATFKAHPGGFEKLSQTTLGRPAIATPALAGGRLFVRAGDSLTAWTVPK